MKSSVVAGFAAIALAHASLAPAAEVGVSVQISQPGVYGRIDIGRFPQPQVVVAAPVIVVRPVVVQQAPPPVYMWVPPGHRKNWRKHCGAYNACGVPVLFVRDEWYGQHVHSEGRDRDKGRGEGHGKDKDKDKGKGHGKGKRDD